MDGEKNVLEKENIREKKLEKFVSYGWIRKV
jgi:hypothetical protein